MDGNDVVAVTDLVASVVERLRAGSGPVLVEAETYRWHGHYEGDPERYRSPDEPADWKKRDPLLVSRRRLTAAGGRRGRSCSAVAQIASRTQKPPSADVP